MARRSWQSMRALAWNAHLVVALLPVTPSPAQGRNVQGLVELLDELIGVLGTTRDYAVTLIDDPEGSSVQCAFEDEYEAARLADTVLATQTPSDGWASRRIFELTEDVVAAIESALADKRDNDGR
jgi:hypothetical protein